MSNTSVDQLKQAVLSDTELTETVARLANTNSESIRHMSKEFWEWVWTGYLIGLQYQSVCKNR